MEQAHAKLLCIWQHSDLFYTRLLTNSMLLEHKRTWQCLMKFLLVYLANTSKSNLHELLLLPAMRVVAAVLTAPWQVT